MIECTASRKRKLNKGNYENEDIMASIKTEIPDKENSYTELERIDSQLVLFLDRREKEYREKNQKEK